MEDSHLKMKIFSHIVALFGPGFKFVSGFRASGDDYFTARYAANQISRSENRTEGFF